MFAAVVDLASISSVGKLPSTDYGGKNPTWIIIFFRRLVT